MIFTTITVKITLIIQTGDNSTHDEKYAAAQEVTRLLGCRGKAKKTIIDGSPFDHSEIAGVGATFIF